jgi:hypothetical protein
VRRLRGADGRHLVQLQATARWRSASARRPPASRPAR